jgi:Cu2+-exporting ATPase
MERVSSTASALGIASENVCAEASPEEKEAYVRSIDRADTLMVGDGLNDAPAFRASYCAATPAVDRPALPSRADFFFLGESMDAVGAALNTARRLGRVIKGNLAFALAYNVAVLTLCFAGAMTPVLAAVLMPASSLGIVAWTAARMGSKETAWK